MIIKARYITFSEIVKHPKTGKWIQCIHKKTAELNTETGKIKTQIPWRGIGWEILSTDDHYLRHGNDGVIEIYRKEDL